jgi:hypothetical protein
MMAPLRSFLRNRLVHPLLPLHLAAIACLLTLPALRVGWQLDDHYQRLALSGKTGSSGLPPEKIFSTLTGDPVANRTYMDQGFLPWWMPLDFRLSFFRALTVWTMQLDYRLWPDSPALMHLHSLLWLGLIVAAAALLYRGIMGPGAAAGLAGLLYALDDTHALPAAWLANRNALLATAFGIACLIAHHRWRQERHAPWAVLSAALLALSLLSGEMGLGAAAYIAAYALCLEAGTIGRRIMTMLPAGAVLGGWALLYRLFGHGTHGSGLYIDPLASTGAFAVAFLRRAPFLLMGQWTPIPADLGAELPEMAVRWLFWGAVVFLAALVAALIPLIRRSLQARFWAAGMLLSLFPIAATFPSNRLLFFVGLGAMGLLAELLAAAFGSRREVGATSAAPGPLLRGFALLMILFHLVLSPAAMPVAAYLPKLMGEPITRSAATVPADPALADQDLVIVTAPDFLLYVSYLPSLMALNDRPLPRHFRSLAAGPSPVELRREDARTLMLRAEGGMLAGTLGRLFRDPASPMKPGDRVELTGFEAEVIQVTADGRPLEVRFRFSVPLEDSSLRWIRWEGDRFVPMAPPRMGHPVKLPPARSPLDL